MLGSCLTVGCWLVKVRLQRLLEMMLCKCLTSSREGCYISVPKDASGEMQYDDRSAYHPAHSHAGALR